MSPRSNPLSLATIAFLSILSLPSCHGSAWHHHRGRYSSVQPTASSAVPSPISSSVPSAAPSTIQGNGNAPALPSPSTNSTATTANGENSSTPSNSNFQGQFWAGADIGTLPRAEAIPGRVFYDYDGTTIKDPVKMLGDAGVNVIRVETYRAQCLGPTEWANNASTLSDELIYKLDFGCIDAQVTVAQRAIAEGMRIVLVINQGFNVPQGMESYSYQQMIDEIQKEAKRQLQPFLDAKILPDVILFENEGSDGFLFNETTGHTRGKADGMASDDKVNQELCGQVPTGNMASYPQYAGYCKAEVLACNAAITSAGFSIETVRYGLHSHAQYVDWKESVVHGGNHTGEIEPMGLNSSPCTSANPIPEELLALNLSTTLNIAGFSAYAEPMTPADINSAASQEAMLARPLNSISLIQGYAETYGKYTEGPFAGQWKLQALGVEWATAYTADQIPQEQALTELLWQKVKTYDAFLGMMWWEPWYCYNDWEGGQATLCRTLPKNGKTGEAPTDTLKTWGAAAISPWK